MMEKKPKVLAISSGGGHWVQLLRLRPAFEGCEVSYATVREGYRGDVGGAPFHLIPDSNRWNKLALLRSAAAIFLLVWKIRPDVVITTGAAPGYFGVQVREMARSARGLGGQRGECGGTLDVRRESRFRGGSVAHAMAASGP